MKNIRFLNKHVPSKKSTEYAVFFEHDGIFARLDWELADSAGDVSPDAMADLMLTQLRYDLEDEVLIEEIRARNAKNGIHSDERVSEWLALGFTEQEAPEFKAKAIEMFGDQ